MIQIPFLLQTHASFPALIRQFTPAGYYQTWLIELIELIELGLLRFSHQLFGVPMPTESTRKLTWLLKITITRAGHDT